MEPEKIAEINAFKLLHEESILHEERMRDLLFRAGTNDEARELIEVIKYTVASLPEFGFALLLSLCMPKCWKCGNGFTARAFNAALVCDRCGERYGVYPRLNIQKCRKCGSSFLFLFGKKFVCSRCMEEYPQSEGKLEIEIEQRSTGERRIYILSSGEMKWMQRPGDRRINKIENINEWRKVTEERPPVGERVLALYHGVDALVAYFGSDGKWYEWDGEEIGNITHWMPLPGLNYQCDSK